MVLYSEAMGQILNRRNERKMGFPYSSLRTFLLLLSFLCVLGLFSVHAADPQGGMTEERAFELSEEFGIDVGEVDEDIKEYLGLTQAEGVVVFQVIGGTPADLAGVKAKSIIKEVDGKEIKTLLELGRALELAMPIENFSVATYEPAGIDDQGLGGGLNFHFVRIQKD
jgi:membrane-associated protease RseP (regulator of RpoE activity)